MPSSSATYHKEDGGANRDSTLNRLTSIIQDRVTYSQGGVAARLGCDVDDEIFIRGYLSLIEKPTGIFIAWTPTTQASDVKGLNDWEELGPPSAASLGPPSAASLGPPSAASLGPSNSKIEVCESVSESKVEQAKRLAFSVDVKDLRSFKSVESKKKDESDWVRFIAKDGSNYVQLYFQSGGLPNFIEHLQKYCTLKRSIQDNNLILFTDEGTEALSQSVSLLFNTPASQASDFFSRLVHNPYPTAIGAFSRVTHVVRDQLLPALVQGDDPAADAAAIMNELMQMNENDETDANDLRLHGDDGFELVTKMDLPDRPCILRDNPLDQHTWDSHKDEEGKVFNTREILLTIFKGGVEPGLRNDVWKYLLGYFCWSDTDKERVENRKTKVDQYFRMKLQWKSFSQKQMDNFSEFGNRKALIEKDVARTDRTHRFYEGDSNANVTMLYDILMTYCMYNFDLGYVQGMSDLLSPILVVMENEVDAFWSFVGLMNRLGRNFEMDQSYIRTQLMQLRDLVMVVNPRLANYLESHQSENMFFAFRWILVHFKREFSFNHIMHLWEVLWTDLPCKNFHLVMCVAILDKEVDTIINNKFGFTEILKYVNDQSMKIDLEQTLVTAEAIFHQLAATQDKLPQHITDILGFSPYGLSNGNKEEENKGGESKCSGPRDVPNRKSPGQAQRSQVSPGQNSDSSIEVINPSL